MEKSLERIPSLDGLRTISIFLVIAGHFLHVVGVGEETNLGNLGVRIFFVISGFLITGLIAREIDKTGTINLLKFYFRRTIRIFPPYYFYLAVLMIGSLVGLISISTRSLLLASIYVTDYVNPSNWLVVHTWSLSVEEQFYLLLPGVLVLFGIRKMKIVLIAIVIASPVIKIVDFRFSGIDPIWVIDGFHANMDALAFGCLLALFRSALHTFTIYRRVLTSPAIVVLPLLILFLNMQGDHPLIYFGFCLSVTNLLIAVGIDWSVTSHGSLVGRFLNSTPMVTLGVMSYSIYLWQQPFFNPDVSSLLTSTPFNFIGLAVMALLSYYVVERYSLVLRKKWESRLFGKEAKRDNLVKEVDSARQALLVSG